MTASTPNPDSPFDVALVAPDYDPALESDFPPLFTSLRFASGFTLLLAVCNQPVISRKLIERLQSTLMPLRLLHIEIEEPVKDLLFALTQQVESAYDGVVAVTGIERHIRADQEPQHHPLIVNLNHFRDRYPAQFPHPLLLIVPSFMLRAIAHGAPDFFSVHSGVFHFEPLLDALISQFTGLTAEGISGWEGMTLDKRTEHMDSLFSHLRELRSLPSDQRNSLSELMVIRTLASQLTSQGKFDEAVRILREAQCAIRKAMLQDHPIASLFHNSLGLVLNIKGDFDSALIELHEAERINRHAFGTGHPKVATELNNIGGVLQSKGDLVGALALYRQSEQIHRGASEVDALEVAMVANNIAGVLHAQGDFDAALTNYHEAEGIVRRTLGKDHPTVATTMNNIGSVLIDMGELDQALEKFQNAELILRTSFGENHPSVGTCINNTASVLRAKGDLQGALAAFQKAERIDRQFLGDLHPKVAADINNIASVLKDKGDLDGALTNFVKAEAIQRRTVGGDHPVVAQILNNIGCIMEDKGKTERARAYYGRALNILLRKLGPRAKDTTLVAQNLLNLGGDPVNLARLIIGDIAAVQLTEAIRTVGQE